MTYQIEITRNGKTKFLGNPLTCQPHKFDDREFAQGFADSVRRNWQLDDRNWGRKTPTYKVVEA